MISDPLVLSIVLIFIMFVFLLSSIWIGVSLILTGIVGMLIFENNLTHFKSNSIKLVNYNIG